MLTDKEAQAIDNYKTNPNWGEREKKVSNITENALKTDFKPRIIYEDDELYRVFVKKNPNIIVFDTQDLEKYCNVYLVLAEDINDFVFDEKDPDLLWALEPVLGKDLMN